MRIDARKAGAGAVAAFVVVLVASSAAHGARAIQGSVGQVTPTDASALGPVGFRIFSALPGGETNFNDNVLSCRNLRCMRNYVTNTNLDPGGYVGNAEATQVYNGDLVDQHFYELVDANMNDLAGNHIAFFGVSGVTANGSGVGQFLLPGCPPPTSTNCFERLDNRFQAPPLIDTYPAYGGPPHTIRAIGGLNPIPNVRIDSVMGNQANLSWNDPPTYAGAMRPSNTPAPAPPSPVLGVRLWKNERPPNDCTAPVGNDPGWTSISTFNLGQTSTQVTVAPLNCTFFALTVRFIGPGGMPNEVETFRVGPNSYPVNNIITDCFDGTPCTDDFNPCTNDVCMENICQHQPMTGNSCSDGDFCTVSDTCTNGVCGGAPRDCSDGNACTSDGCSSAGGTCTHANVNNGSSCNDQNACTLGDSCSNGVCVGGSPNPCDDGNPCTDQTCVAPTGCSYTNNTAACDDGNGCTVNDVCAGGGCGGTTITAPPEVAHDRFPSRTMLAWDAVPNAAPGTVYDVTRGRANELPPGSGVNEICRATNLTGTTLTVSEFPPIGRALWYLVRARNTCGGGTWGTWSNGVPRVPPACP